MMKWGECGWRGRERVGGGIGRFKGGFMHCHRRISLGARSHKTTSNRNREAFFQIFWAPCHRSATPCIRNKLILKYRISHSNMPWFTTHLPPSHPAIQSAHAAIKVFSKIFSGAHRLKLTSVHAHGLQNRHWSPWSYGSVNQISRRNKAVAQGSCTRPHTYIEVEVPTWVVAELVVQELLYLFAL